MTPATRRGAAAAAAAACVLALTVTGCSRSGAVDDTSTPVALVSRAGDGSGMSAIVAGPITVDAQGCVRVGGRLALWPGGTVWDPEADALRLSSGALVARGQSVAGGGGEVDGSVARAALAEGQPLDRCSWTGKVAMFNPGTPVVAAPA